MALTLRAHSDVHTEFSEWNYLHLAEDSSSVLVLAGDVGLVNHPTGLARITKLLKQASNDFRAVVYVMGNHEFYHRGNLTKCQSIIQSFLDSAGLDNVHLLENDVVTIDDVAFIGATLWTNYDNNISNYWLSKRYMADYTNIVITEGKPPANDEEVSEQITRFIMPEDLHNIHKISKTFIFDAIDKYHADGYKTVVVTHHGPTRKSTHPRFAHDTNNFNFVSELTQDIIIANPNLWLHGHIHDAMDYYVDETQCQTRVIANPRGYPNENRGTSDDPGLQVII